jgi:hypothetical protein
MTYAIIWAEWEHLGSIRYTPHMPHRRRTGCVLSVLASKIQTWSHLASASRARGDCAAIETARIRIAGRRRCCMAACGACAVARDASGGISGPHLLCLA